MGGGAAQEDRAAQEGRSRERFFATLSKPKAGAAAAVRARRQPARRRPREDGPFVLPS